MSTSKTIKACRICGNPQLDDILDLGRQPYSGFFPEPGKAEPPAGELVLVKCRQDQPSRCGLVQLKHDFELGELYGDNYGYRSGLNPSMVRHLDSLRNRAVELAKPAAGDLVVDIGSNDGTLLKGYPAFLERVGIDPTIAKFGRFYPDDIRKVPSFFNEATRQAHLAGRKARIVSSISMFYDLPDPQEFVGAIQKLLAPTGIWLFEQSYLPLMIDNLAFDTVCHEHLEYYSLGTIQWLLERAGLRIVHAELTSTNGGSILLMAAHADSPYPACAETGRLLALEEKQGYSGLEVHQKFSRAVEQRIEEVRSEVRRLKEAGHRVLGYGASTKGNVVLNACGFTANDLDAILEVNEDKFGHETPGSKIPIVAESTFPLQPKDVLLVLPWHFRDFIVQKLAARKLDDVTLLFPMPRLEKVRV